jgi:hypothetical protein
LSLTRRDPGSRADRHAAAFACLRESRPVPSGVLTSMRLGTAASAGRTKRSTYAFGLGTRRSWAGDETTARDEQQSFARCLIAPA